MHNDGCGNRVVLFEIGRALDGHIDESNREIFGNRFKFIFLHSVATQARNFYKDQLKSARAAVNAWVFVGMRCGVVKDVRKLISQMIWEARKEANYK